MSLTQAGYSVLVLNEEESNQHLKDVSKAVDLCSYQVSLLPFSNSKTLDAAHPEI